MPAIKCKSFDEARLAVLLHQSQQREDAMASNIVNLSMRCNRLTEELINIKKSLEIATCRVNQAEREMRTLKALRYSSRRKRQGVDGVNA